MHNMDMTRDDLDLELEFDLGITEDLPPSSDTTVDSRIGIDDGLLESGSLSEDRISSSAAKTADVEAGNMDRLKRTASLLITKKEKPPPKSSWNSVHSIYSISTEEAGNVSILQNTDTKLPSSLAIEKDLNKDDISYQFNENQSNENESMTSFKDELNCVLDMSQLPPSSDAAVGSRINLPSSSAMQKDLKKGDSSYAYKKQSNKFVINFNYEPDCVFDSQLPPSSDTTIDSRISKTSIKTNNSKGISGITEVFPPSSNTTIDSRISKTPIKTNKVNVNASSSDLPSLNIIRTENNKSDKQSSVRFDENINAIITELDAVLESSSSNETPPNENKKNFLPIGIFLLLMFPIVATFLFLLDGTNNQQSSNILENFPTSYKVFLSSRHRRATKIELPKIDNDVIPVFFDLQGQKSDFILSILNNCYNMTADLILMNSNGHLNVDSMSRNPDFIYTNSLCAVSKLLETNNKRARIFTILYNPIVRSLISFTRRQDQSSPYFELRSVGLSFHQYLSFNRKQPSDTGNALTKAILCKDGSHQVSKEDYELAREYMDEYVVNNKLQDYKDVFAALIRDFPPKQNKDNKYADNANSMHYHQNNCVRQLFIKKSNHIDQIYLKNIGGNNFDEYLQGNIHGTNKYDSMLYLDKHRMKNQ